MSDAFLTNGRRPTGGMTRRRFLQTATAGAAAAALGFPAIVRASNAAGRRLIVLGIDGMDPSILHRFRSRGLMPNAARLMEAGSFLRLGTSDPPQSPVAWANFTAGTNPGGHGIYDFIARDAATRTPYLSTSRLVGEARSLKLGSWRIPLGGAEMVNMRGGPTLWTALEDHGIPATMFRIPANFPPTPSRQTTLAGLGVPDIHGGYGIFTYYSDRIGVISRDVQGGRIERVHFKNRLAEFVLKGPKNTLRDGSPDTAIPFQVAIDPPERTARIVFQGQTVVLKEGEWSDWVLADFALLPIASVSGIFRFFLKQCRADFELYATPINIDPAKPAFPLSTPEDYARDLVRQTGYYYTQGMAENTSALQTGILTDDEYRMQAVQVLEESRRLFDYTLPRFSDGLYFFYFSCLDMNSHMFWRTLDPDHCLYTPELAKAQGDFLPWLYGQMDAVIGQALDAVDDHSELVVISDHGFGSFRRQFNLNSWLMDNGYAEAVPGASRGTTDYFADIRWQGTRAYGLGINGLYFNQAGREPDGTVRVGAEADALAAELQERLTALRDPETGAAPITRVCRPQDIYSGPYLDRAPDLLICYNINYRASWDTIQGKYPREHFLDNREAWSGDHCIDGQLIPGVFLSTAGVGRETADLTDMAPSILDWFGVPVPPAMTGKPLLQRRR